MPVALFRIEKKRWQIGMACVMAELSRQNRKAGATLFAMNQITQDMRFKQAAIECSLKHGVSAASGALLQRRPEPRAGDHGQGLLPGGPGRGGRQGQIPRHVQRLHLRRPPARRHRPG